MCAKWRKKRSKKRILRKIISLIFITGLFSIAFGYYSFTQLLRPAAGSENPSEKRVTVPNGASSQQIGKIMADQGLIQSGLAFRIYVKSKGLEDKLQAGEYVFNTGQSTQEIARKIARGETLDISFTIPEGYTLKQIADKLEESGFIDKTRFMDLAANEDFDYDFIKGLPKGPNRLEGYLYPDTYKVTTKTNEKQILQMMLARFQREITPEFREKLAKQGITLHQAVILASIVEREAKKDDERPKVAAVFLNRIKKGWKLESCATVQYALGTNKTRLLTKDLQVESPYNTYLNKGLPTGPIASPGKPSLQAVANPAKNDYMFFVVYEDGKHVFSRTLIEHNRAKAAYLNRLKNSQ